MITLEVRRKRAHTTEPYCIRSHKDTSALYDGARLQERTCGLDLVAGRRESGGVSSLAAMARPPLPLPPPPAGGIADGAPALPCPVGLFSADGLVATTGLQGTSHPPKSQSQAQRHHSNTTLVTAHPPWPSTATTHSVTSHL